MLWAEQISDEVDPTDFILLELEYLVFPPLTWPKYAW